MPRYDTDEMVMTKSWMPITEIFAKSGEEEFRHLEKEALAAYSSYSAPPSWSRAAVLFCVLEM